MLRSRVVGFSSVSPITTIFPLPLLSLMASSLCPSSLPPSCTTSSCSSLSFSPFASLLWQWARGCHMLIIGHRDGQLVPSECPQIFFLTHGKNVDKIKIRSQKLAHSTLNWVVGHRQTCVQGGTGPLLHHSRQQRSLSPKGSIVFGHLWTWPMGSSVIFLPYQVIFKRLLRPPQPGFFNVWMTCINNMFLATSHHRKIPFWAQTYLNWRGAKGRLKPGESCGKLDAKKGYLSINWCKGK